MGEANRATEMSQDFSGCLEDKILDRLAFALKQGRDARGSGGTPQMINHAYQAVDNYFSAVLVHATGSSPFNHVKKMRAAWQHIGPTLEEGGLQLSEIQQFHGDWLASRYGDLVAPLNEVFSYLRYLDDVQYEVLKFFAEMCGSGVDDLEEFLFERAYRGQIKWSRALNHIIDIDEGLSAAIEDAYQTDGMRVFNPITSLDFTLDSNDPTTGGIVSSDEKATEIVASLYREFIRLVYRVVEAREGMGLGKDSPVTAFSIQFAYREQDEEEGKREFQDRLRRMGFDPDHMTKDDFVLFVMGKQKRDPDKAPDINES